ncbi:MAG TPA: hypothetical protein VHH53_01170 [Pseudonocardiaceae bacterium]|nr:hypothetical protein [Pseudonocardiaceae bacterium]
MPGWRSASGEIRPAARPRSSSSGSGGWPLSRSGDGWRGQSSIGPVRGAIEIAGEDTVREAFSDAVAQFRQPDGSYRQENVFRYVIAGKPA